MDGDGRGVDGLTEGLWAEGWHWMVVDWGVLALKSSQNTRSALLHINNQHEHENFPSKLKEPNLHTAQIPVAQ